MSSLALRTLAVLLLALGALALTGLAQPPRLPAPLQELIR